MDLDQYKTELRGIASDYQDSVIDDRWHARVLAVLRRVREESLREAATIASKDAMTVWQDAPLNTYAAGYRMAGENIAFTVTRAAQ